MKFGYQLSSITPYLQTEGDLRESLGKIAAIGYTEAQLQGVPYDIPDNAVAAALRESGLACAAMQEDFPVGFDSQPRRAVERALACGCKYLSFAKWPGLLASREELARYAEALAPVCEMARNSGLILSFHPIGPDFMPLEGVPVYERLMERLPDSVQLTFCVSSCFGTGVEPAGVLKKFAGRVDLAHFKEVSVQPDGPHLVPLGEGNTDWPSIAADCQEAGVQYVFAEQERWDRDAFDCAAASFRYLKKLRTCEYRF